MRQSCGNIMETSREHQTWEDVEQKRMKSQKVCEPAFQANVVFTTSHFLLVQKKTPTLIFLQLGQLGQLSKLPNHHSIVNAGGVDVPKQMLPKYKL